VNKSEGNRLAQVYLKNVVVGMREEQHHTYISQTCSHSDAEATLCFMPLHFRGAGEICSVAVLITTSIL